MDSNRVFIIPIFQFYCSMNTLCTIYLKITNGPNHNPHRFLHCWDKFFWMGNALWFNLPYQCIIMGKNKIKIFFFLVKTKVKYGEERKKKSCLIFRQMTVKIDMTRKELQNNWNSITLLPVWERLPLSHYGGGTVWVGLLLASLLFCTQQQGGGQMIVGKWQQISQRSFQQLEALYNAFILPQQRRKDWIGLRNAGMGWVILKNWKLQFPSIIVYVWFEILLQGWDASELRVLRLSAS